MAPSDLGVVIASERSCVNRSLPVRLDILQTAGRHQAAYKVDRVVPVLQQQSSHVLVDALLMLLVAIGLVSDEELHQAFAGPRRTSLTAT